MLNSIREVRIRNSKGIYDLRLEIPEKEFFLVYDDANQESAHDLIKQYLVYREDDARPQNIGIEYDRNKHIVSVNSELHYLENDHTNYS